MKILITGGAGFIGSHTTRLLLERGDKVVCVDNLNNYYSPAQKRKNITPFQGNTAFKMYKEDIVEYEKLKQIFKEEKPDKIIHLAARVGVRPSMEQPFLYEEVNVRGTLNVLELARHFAIQNLIVASSSSVYGNNKKVPFSETDSVDKPISQYAVTKKAAELLCHTYHHLYKLNISCLRFFTVYGPGGRPDMAPYLFTKNIIEGKPIKRFGDGKSQRDYTYIDDIVKGIVAALDKNYQYEIFNLGNNQSIALNKIIKIIESLLNKKAKIQECESQPGDVKKTYADITKAKKKLGYRPRVSVEKGMEKFIKWYLANKK
ncbi:GDP-mannose 4,6-dehydratase [Candidatus Peregrinibacteria bacterium]|nr:GDP-mannose 4,6-dehydratase [Candidatus Peregrinibacteria bacterium]